MSDSIIPVSSLFFPYAKKQNHTHGVTPQVRRLQKEIAKLRREVDALRSYGNKDCTAMADEFLASGEN